MIKCFQPDNQAKKFTILRQNEHKPTEQVQITALNYGPYDNGHIIIGFSNGYILVLNSFDLASMFRIKIFESFDFQASPCDSLESLSPSAGQIPVTSIIFDPT